MPSRVPPHNLPAEQSLLGAAMLSSAALEVLGTEVAVDDFYSPKHQAIAVALRSLWEAGVIHADPVLVADELAAHKQLDMVGGITPLMEYRGNTPATSSASRYAAIVVDHAVKRRLIGAGAEITAAGYNLELDATQSLDRAREQLGTIELPLGDPAPSPNVYEFMQVEISYDWLVVGLLERRDRLILTGGEGAGKSTLLRQVAVQLAAGVHPFRFHPTQPVAVLVVDVENSRAQIVRKLEPLVGIVDRRLDPDNLRYECRTEGLDLLRRSDSQWLLERVAANRPDVLIIGPIYKLHHEDPKDEQAAARVIHVLDVIRARYDCTLVIEAHSPHGDTGRRRPLRPIGASVWMRWPEFGYGLRRDGQTQGVWFETWRGPRDEREWPARLSRGGRDQWPWRDSSYLPPGYEEGEGDHAPPLGEPAEQF